MKYIDSMVSPAGQTCIRVLGDIDIKQSVEGNGHAYVYKWDDGAKTMIDLRIVPADRTITISIVTEYTNTCLSLEVLDARSAPVLNIPLAEALAAFLTHIQADVVNSDIVRKIWRDQP